MDAIFIMLIIFYISLITLIVCAILTMALHKEDSQSDPAIKLELCPVV
jgi:hypothetical protein